MIQQRRGQNRQQLRLRQATYGDAFLYDGSGEVVSTGPDVEVSRTRPPEARAATSGRRVVTPTGARRVRHTSG